MAIINAIATGNWSSPSTWPGGTLPGAADEVHANGFNITIDQNITVIHISTRAAGGGNTGGRFYGTDGILITADVYAGGYYALMIQSGYTVSILGNVYGSDSTGYAPVYISGGSHCIITGDVIGGSVTNAYSIYVIDSSQLEIIGNVTGGSGTNCYLRLYGNAASNAEITGNVTGGTGAYAIYHNGGVLLITGDVQGNIQYGVYIVGGVSCTIIGSAIGGSNIAGVYNANASGVLSIDTLRAGTGFSGMGLYNNCVTPALIKNLDFQTTERQVPIRGPITFVPTGGYNIDVYTATGVASFLPEPLACDFPAESDVRDGVIFGSGTFEGTCAVPPAESVAHGVPVDDTVGSSIIAVDDAVIVALVADIAIIKANTDDIDIDLTPVLDGIADLDADIYDLTHVDGEEIPRVIPPPDGPNTCRVFMGIYDQASTSPVLSVTATATLVNLPYYYDGKYHVGDVLDAELTAPDAQGNRHYYWDLVWGATVTFNVLRAGIAGEATIPESATADLETIIG